MLFHRRTVSTTDCFGKACTSTIWDNSCAVSACAPWYAVLTLHCPKHFVHLAARDKDSIIPKSFKKTSNVAHRRTASQTLAPWISNDMPAQVRSKTTRPRAPKGKGRIREVHGCVLGYVDFRGIRSLCQFHDALRFQQLQDQQRLGSLSGSLSGKVRKGIGEGVHNKYMNEQCWPCASCFVIW